MEEDEKEKNGSEQCWVEKRILTGKVAGEEKDQGEDDQEGDVCLQDTCSWPIRREKQI